MNNKTILYVFTVSILIFHNVHSAERGGGTSQESVEALRGTVEALSKTVGALQEACNANPQGSSGFLGFLKLGTAVTLLGYFGYQVYSSESMWSTPEGSEKSLEKSNIHLNEKSQQLKALCDKNEQEIQGDLTKVQKKLNNIGINLGSMKKSTENVDRLRADVRETPANVNTWYKDSKCRAEQKDLFFQEAAASKRAVIKENYAKINFDTANGNIQHLQASRMSMEKNVNNVIRRNQEEIGIQNAKISAEIQNAKNSLSDIKDEVYVSSNNLKELTNKIDNVHQQKKEDNDCFERLLNTKQIKKPINPPQRKAISYHNNEGQNSKNYIKSKPKTSTTSLPQSQPLLKNTSTKKVFGIKIQTDE